MAVYENKHYIVEAHEDNKGYVVYNKATGVNEGETRHLPGAQILADQFSEHLSKGDKEVKNELTVVSLRQNDPQ